MKTAGFVYLEGGKTMTFTGNPFALFGAYSAGNGFIAFGVSDSFYLSSYGSASVQIDASGDTHTVKNNDSRTYRVWAISPM